MNQVIKIGIRSLILTVFIAIATLVVTSILDYERPALVAASQNQFDNNNQSYQRARALATSDPTAPVMMIAGVLYILVWSVAGWQWWKLAQENKTNA